MKKIILLSAIALNSLFVKAQENNTWRWGAQIGMHGNQAKFAGGMANANARFHQNPFGSPALNFNVRYDYNQRWAFTSGLGFSSIGYEFAIAENYSFLNKNKRYTSINSSVGLVEIPLLAIYKFKQNCNNWKWVASGGFVGVVYGAQTNDKQFNPNNDGQTSQPYISSTTTTNGGGNVHARFLIGKEKLFRNGSIFNASFIWNAGFGIMATSTVKYTIDGQNYEHKFNNTGNFFGVRFAYFLKPCKNVSAKAVKK
jgi:hypothetical protein